MVQPTVTANPFLSYVAGGLQVLDDYVAADTALDWTDVHSYFRTITAVYNRTVIGVPLTASVSLMYYRRDVLQAFNITPPTTWDGTYVFG
jgi:ABC-type glycerol-3-phosphate transport system substrate-binding protein